MVRLVIYREQGIIRRAVQLRLIDLNAAPNKENFGPYYRDQASNPMLLVVERVVTGSRFTAFISLAHRFCLAYPRPKESVSKITHDYCMEDSNLD